MITSVDGKNYRRTIDYVEALGFAYCKRYETEAEAIEVSHDLWPLTFDELCADIEAHPLVEQLQAGFGLELVTCDRPVEQLGNLVGLEFIACEALSTVAHDWGHCRLSSYVTDTMQYRPGLSAPDESWLAEDSHGVVAPLTEDEADRVAERMSADGEDGYRWWALWRIGSHFYRADAEDEALSLLAMLNRADAQARAEGVEL